MDQNEQNLKQRKIALAQSEHSGTIVDLMKDCATPITDIIGKNEFDTLVNAITLEVEGKMMVRMADYITKIRQGILHEQK
jgi:hypothetical protein